MEWASLNCVSAFAVHTIAYTANDYVILYTLGNQYFKFYLSFSVLTENEKVGPVSKKEL